LGLIQDDIVQYHVKATRRYGDNCSVWCQIWSWAKCNPYP